MSEWKSDGITRDKAILLTASGRKIGEITQLLGLSRPTYRRMAEKPEFQKEVETVRAQLIRQYKAQTLSVVPLAFKTLRKMMLSDNHGAAIRACLAVLQSVGAIGEPEKQLDTSKKVLKLSFVPPNRKNGTTNEDNE